MRKVKDMDTFYLIIILALVAGLVVVMLKNNKPEKDDHSVEIMQKMLSEIRQESRENLRDLRTEVSKELTEARKMQHAGNRELNQRLDKSAEIISGVHKQLGQVGEATKQIFEVGKDITSLQEILRSPKMRGNFGEILLENLLEQMMPGRFKMQYTFKTGERADAVLKLKDGKVVAIDSKFPLEDFQRLVGYEGDEEAYKKLKKALITQTKKHVDAVANKYILPDEGTLDFAFLYVPAENVYYELTTSDENILDYAWKKKVFMVSPNSFYAYLVTVLQGLRALQIGENIQKIQGRLGKLAGEFGKLEDDFNKVGTHLRNASSAYASSEKRLGKVSDNLEKALEGDYATTKMIESEEV